MMNELDNKFMAHALELAQLAYSANEVPIGCVIVHEGIIIGKGYNQRNTLKNTLKHAEIIAIDQACAYLNDWRLDNCTMYVTLEPCPMCAGAILQARLPRLVYGAKNPKAGAAGSLLNILNDPRFNHTCQITTGILENNCTTIMKSFFASLRKQL